LRYLFGAVGILALLALGPLAGAQEKTGTVRTYYIAADEIDWDYMPGGGDNMMGMAPHGYAKFFAQHGSKFIGRVYHKAVYREYTDATFTHLKPRPTDQAYLGTVGPIVHAEVGDTLRIVFHNHGTHPYSIHAHGVEYDKASEGSLSAGAGNVGVAPGATRTYTYSVPERAGPGPNDPSSIVWLYHSHVNERRDVNAGLIGAIVVTKAGMATPDGLPKDVDHEFVALFMAYDENSSWFIDQNVRRFVKDRKHLSKVQTLPFDPDGRVDAVFGTGFIPANFRFTINGYQYADGPVMTMHRGDHVRWYLLSLGEGLNIHTPHWHGNTVLVGGQRTDVAYIGPASMVTADMVPDDPGTWLLHCHFSEHMEGGMVARYRVLP